MITPIIISLRKSSIGRTYYGVQRYIKSDKKFKDKSTINIRSILPRNLNIVARVTKMKLVLAIVLTLILSILFLFFHQYLVIQPKNFGDFDTSPSDSPRLTDKKELNVVLYGLDVDRTNVEGEYLYIDFIAVISSSSKRTSLAILNPRFNIDIDSSERVPVSSYLNRLEGEDEEQAIDPFIGLNNEVQSLLGIRVDRYITFNNTDFFSTWESYGVSIESEVYQGVSIFDSGDIVTDGQLVVQEEYILEVIQTKFSFFEKYKYFWDAKDLLEIFRTDMSKSEIFSFVDNVSSSSLQSTIISNNASAEFIPSSSLTPNYLLIDEKIYETFHSLDIISEQAELEVYNSSDISGLATNKAREFQNLGANVVKYGNYFKVLENNTLFVLNESDLNTFRNTIEMIKRSLRGKLEIIIQEYEYNRTGNLILVFGQNQ